VTRERATVIWGLALAIVVPPGVVWAQPPPPPPATTSAAPPPPPPTSAAPPPPPPSESAPQAPAPTRATFVSTTSEQWDVLVDNQPTCATPCTGPLFPQQVVVLRSQDSDPVLLEVGRLPPGDLLVSGKPLQRGMYAGGIVATTLGGMALAVGITLTAVGLAKDRSGLTTAGVITGGVGALALPGGIYLMVKALPAATVGGAPPQVSGMAAGLAGSF